MIFDKDIDVRIDANQKDPDGHSKILNEMHKIAWSKILPNGLLLNLNSKIDDDGLFILTADFDSNQIILSSDIIVTTYTDRWEWHQIGKDVIPQIMDEKKQVFDKVANTFGSFILFPKRMKDGKTINQYRGTNPKLYDRFDLALECLRRYYDEEDSPLFSTFKRYDSYLKMFLTFEGFCSFFLLQDIVSDDFKKVNFFIPFVDFNNNPLPKNIVEYNQFMENCIVFIKKRNCRIEEYLKNNCV